MPWTRTTLALLIGAIGLAGSPAATAQDDRERAQQLIVQLGDADPAVRETAMQALWELGDAAAPLLEVAARSKDPEVASRASLLLSRMRLGVGPEASQSLVRLVVEARDADSAAQRAQARQRLAAMSPEAAPAIARLLGDAIAGTLIADDPASLVLRDLWPADRWTLALVADQLAQQEGDAALLEWLENSAAAGAAAHYAFAVSESGDLPQAVARWRQRVEAEPSREHRRVLACLLFAAGDDERSEHAAALGQGGDVLPVAWALLEGDMPAAGAAARAHPDELTRLALELIVARAAGDGEAPASAALRQWLGEGAPMLREAVRAQRTEPHLAAARRAIVAATFAGDLQSVFLLSDEVDAAGLVRVLYRRFDFQDAEDVAARHAQRDDPQRRAVQVMQQRMMNELRMQRGGRADASLSTFAQRRIEAVDCLRRREFSRAAELLGELARTDEADPALRWSLGHSLSEAGEADAGGAEMERALSMALADSLVRRGIAQEMWLVGSREESVEQYRQMARWSTLVLPDALSAMEVLGARLMEEKRFEEAKRAFAAAAVVLMAQGMYEHLADDDRGLHWSFLVASELERSRMNEAALAGEWAEAQAALERSLSYLPETQPVIDLVSALEAADRKGDADRLFIESFGRISSAVGRYRQSALLNNQAAWLAASCNRRLDTALNLAQTAVACDSGSAAALDTLAEVYLRMGQAERARELLERVLALAESQDVGNAAPYGQFNAYLERRQDFLERLEEPAAGD